MCFSLSSLSHCYQVDYFFRMFLANYRAYLNFERCRRNYENDNFSPTAKEIYIAQRSYFFRIIDSNYIYVPIFESVHMSRRVTWAFLEALIIVMPIKFEQFYERLSKVRQQIVWDSYWRIMREHYLTCCKLLEKTTDFASPLLTPTTFADFFSFCERLFKQFAYEKRRNLNS